MDDRWFCDTELGQRFPGFTRGNAADVLPDPVSPLGWTFVWEGAIAPGARDGFIDYGLLDWSEFDDPTHPDTFGLFGGYFYNPLSLVRLMGARIPGGSPEMVDAAFFDDRDDVPPYEREDWHDSERHAAKLTETLGWVMSATEVSRVDADRVWANRIRAERPDLSSTHEAVLLARARSLVPVLEEMFDSSIYASLGSSVGPGALAAICEGLGDPSLVVRLLAGIEVDSAQPSWQMWDLSRLVAGSSTLTAAFDAGVSGLPGRLEAATDADTTAFWARFGQLLVAYGSRGPNEWDLRAKVWETHPELALAAIDRMRLATDGAAPGVRHAAALAERDRVLADVRERLADDAEATTTFEAAMASSAMFLAARERYKTNCVKVIGEIRLCVLELARRAVDAGHLDHPWQVFMCRADELDAIRFEPATLRDELARREAAYHELFELVPPYVVHRQVPPLSEWARRSDAGSPPAGAGEVLTGVGGSGGSATGTARVLLDPSDPSVLGPGDVLVAPNTDPSWTPLFVPAAAVVVDVGAMGSHAMIISRELGIPCVVSVPDATSRIPDGATVTVDGTNGTVTLA